MSKKNYITLVVGIVGTLVFGTGLCMCLLPEWNAFNRGVFVSVIGAVILIILAAARRRMDGKPAVKLSARTVGITLYAAFSTIVFGAGVCMILVWEMMIQGILVGVLGIILLLGLIPVIKGLK